MKLLENIYKRLLRESMDDTSRLAAYVREEFGERRAVIYNPQELLDHIAEYTGSAQKYDLDNYTLREKLHKLTADTAVKGIINVAPPRNPCWGAWKVTAAAAPGGPDIARITYGLGYALSDGGVLMSDRGSMSKKAKAAWERVYAGNKRQRLELDDVSLPVDKRRTPDFPGDDCKLYRGTSKLTPPEKNPHLQYAYKSQGWEKDRLHDLVAMHEMFMDEVEEEFGSAATKAAMRLLSFAESEFFSKHYEGPDND
jgi:hypothetical protein